MVALEKLDDEVGLSQHTYGDTVVFAADFGPGVDGTVDVVEDTAIVLADGDQHELDLPTGDAQAFMKNGVLTIEVNG